MLYHFHFKNANATAVMVVTFLLLSAMRTCADTCTVGSPLSGGKQYDSNSIGNVGNGYSYQYWSNKVGAATMTIYGVDAAFKVTWTNIGNYVGRVGLGFNKTKTHDQIGTISADFAFTKTQTGTGGLAYIGIYGWSVDSMHEYYIVEDWFGGRPTYAGTRIATITVDGGAYDVLTHTQVNQPSITGSNATFVQFWSLRQTARQCGHISVSEHFRKWDSLGLKLGKMEETRILVESMNNSGTIDFTKGTVVVGSANVSYLPGTPRERGASFSSRKGSGVLSFFSLNGTRVRSVRQDGSGTAFGSTAPLPNGVYLLQFQGDGKALVTRTLFLK
jgi:hypothetical protein